MADVLRFREEDHTYWLGQRELPSVSRVISPVVNFDGIPPNVLAAAANRGKAVHYACELHDKDDLDWTSLDSRIEPYLRAYVNFLADWEPLWTEIEQIDCSPELGVAGTPDRRGATCKQLINGVITEVLIGGVRKWRNILVDLKATYALNPSVQVQLSGYDLMREQKADELWSVRLKNDGTYERTVHAQAHSTFLSCLNIYNWRLRNGVK